MLQSFRTESSLVQPIDTLSGLYMHLSFKFDPTTSSVVVTNWLVTDEEANQLDLNSLKFSELAEVYEALVSETSFHSELYYEALESNYYNRVG